MHDNSFVSRWWTQCTDSAASRRSLAAAEAVTLTAGSLAYVLTVLLVTEGYAVETNPVAATLASEGWAVVGLVAVAVTYLGFEMLRWLYWVWPRRTVAAGWVAAAAISMNFVSDLVFAHSLGVTVTPAVVGGEHLGVLLVVLVVYVLGRVEVSVVRCCIRIGRVVNPGPRARVLGLTLFLVLGMVGTPAIVAGEPTEIEAGSDHPANTAFDARESSVSSGASLGTNENNTETEVLLSQHTTEVILWNVSGDNFSKMWEYNTNDAFASAGVVNSTHAVAVDGNTVYRLWLDNGTVDSTSSINWDRTEATAVTWSNDKFFVANQTGIARAWNFDGTVAWENDLKQGVIDSGDAIDYAGGYVAVADGFVFVLDASTGSEIINNTSRGANPVVLPDKKVVKNPENNDGNVDSYDWQNDEFTEITTTASYLVDGDARNGEYLYHGDYRIGGGSLDFAVSESDLSGATKVELGGTYGYLGDGDDIVKLYKNNGTTKTSITTKDSLNNLDYYEKADSSGSSVSGTVTDRDGDPVSNATVQITGYNRDKFSGNTDEINDSIEDIREQLEHPEPSAWTDQQDSQFSITERNGLLDSSTSPVVLAHTRADWDVPPVGETQPNVDPELGQPLITLPEDQEVVFSLWQPKDPVLEDGVDGDIQGWTTTTGTIVVEQLAPSGGVRATSTYQTEDIVQFQSFGKTHEAVRFDLAPGFYRVYPQGNPSTSYLITVGTPDQILEPYINDLKDKNETLTDRVQTLQDKKDDGKVVQKTVQADASGQFSADLNDSFDQVSIVAHRAPAGLNGSEVSRADILDYYDSLVLNDEGELRVTLDLDSNETTDVYEQVGARDSYYISAGVTDAEPPASNLTVDVAEVSAPPLTNQSARQNLSEWRDQFLERLDLSELPPWLQERLENLTRDELEQIYIELDALRAANDDLEDKYIVLLEANIDGEYALELDPDEATDQQLIDRIVYLSQALAQLPNTIDPDDPEPDIGDNTVSVIFPFDVDLEPENVAVRVHYSNGTSEPIPTDSDYVIVEDRIGGDAVIIDEYPLPDDDTAIAEFEVIIATDDETGSITLPVRNPDFDGEIPRLDAIRVTSLRPSTGDNVTVTAIPRDESKFGNLTNVTVTGPDGEAATSTVGPRSKAFVADKGVGVYDIRLKYTNANGTTFVERTRVKAVARAGDQPPSMLILEGPTGFTATVGDGLQSGAVAYDDRAQKLQVSPRVQAGTSPPGVIHIYAQGVDLPSEATAVVRLQDTSGRSVSKQVGVVMHLPSYPDDATYWRGESNDQPLYEGESNEYGSVTTDGNQTAITTYTKNDGTVALETNADPNIVEGVLHDVAGSPLGGILFLTPTALLGLVAVIGLRRRGRPELRGARRLAVVVMAAMVVVATISIGAGVAHAAPTDDAVDTQAFSGKVTPAAADVCGIQFGSGLGCSPVAGQTTHGRTGAPVWYIWTDSAESLDDLETWANDSSDRTVLSRDNGSQRARLAAPAMDVIDPVWNLGESGLRDFAYVEGVDVARGQRMPTQPPDKTASQFDHPRDTFVSSVPSAGIAFSEDANRSTLGDAHQVTDADDVQADGSGVTVAVLDASLNSPDPNNDPLFGSRLAACRNTITDSDGCENVSGSEIHGHWVASAIAANATNDTYDGVVPNATLLYAKVLNDDGEGSVENIIEGLQWAEANGADVVALSLGSSQYSAALAQEVREVLAGNVTIVSVAAGNSRYRGGRADISSPADTDAPGVITVAAANNSTPAQAGVAWFSNTGPDRGTDGSRGATRGQQPDIAAPGMEVTAPVIMESDARRNVTLSGTSMAQPMVAGAVAALLDADPSLMNESTAVRDRLRATAVPMPNAGETETAWGMVNVERLVDDNATDTSQSDARNEPARQRDDANRAIGLGFFGFAAAPADRQPAAAAV